MHPHLSQEAVLKTHNKLNIRVSPYSSIGAGKDILSDPKIGEIAQAKGVSPAQVTLRWHFQRGCMPLVKTSKKERLTENIGVFNFELTEEEMAVVDSLNQNKRIVNPTKWPGPNWGGLPFFE